MAKRKLTGEELSKAAKNASSIFVEDSYKQPRLGNVEENKKKADRMIQEKIQRMSGKRIPMGIMKNNSKIKQYLDHKH